MNFSIEATRLGAESFFDHNARPVVSCLTLNVARMVIGIVNKLQQLVVIFEGQLVQLVVHIATDGGTILFDLGDVPYRIVGVAIRGVVAVGYRTDQMGACIGSAATCQVGIGFGQQSCAGGFDNALRG